MGHKKVLTSDNEAQKSRFIHALLRDMEALEYMLRNDWFESGITRIGAEQELCRYGGIRKNARLPLVGH